VRLTVNDRGGYRLGKEKGAGSGRNLRITHGNVKVKERKI